MSKVDGRKVSHDVREAIRIQAIQKWLDGAKVQRLSKERVWYRFLMYLPLDLTLSCRRYGCPENAPDSPQ